MPCAFSQSVSQRQNKLEYSTLRVQFISYHYIFIKYFWECRCLTSLHGKFVWNRCKLPTFGNQIQACLWNSGRRLRCKKEGQDATPGTAWAIHDPKSMRIAPAPQSGRPLPRKSRHAALRASSAPKPSQTIWRSSPTLPGIPPTGQALVKWRVTPKAFAM